MSLCCGSSRRRHKRESEHIVLSMAKSTVGSHPTENPSISLVWEHRGMPCHVVQITPLPTFKRAWTPAMSGLTNSIEAHAGRASMPSDCVWWEKATIENLWNPHSTHRLCVCPAIDQLSVTARHTYSYLQTSLNLLMAEEQT